MNYYNAIKSKLIKTEVSKKIREYVNNKNDLSTYYEVGKLLTLAGKQYAVKLQNDLGKKYNVSTLKRMRQFYRFIKSQSLDDQYNLFDSSDNQKGAPVAHLLTWSHYQELLPIKDNNEINYYINEVIKYHLSKRELRERIKNKEYERLSDNTRKKLINKEKMEITDLVKEPIVLHSKNSYEKISEYALKEIIMNDLDSFLMQLGNGFCYIGNEYKIKIGNTYNYIDLLLFNIRYNCYVVVELKINEVRKQDIGQIQVYMNYVNENIKEINQNKTIGIIVARENNKYIIKYSSDNRIMVTTYEIV